MRNLLCKDGFILFLVFLVAALGAGDKIICLLGIDSRFRKLISLPLLYPAIF